MTIADASRVGPTDIYIYIYTIAIAASPLRVTAMATTIRVGNGRKVRRKTAAETAR